jgi:hypothetical protein
VDFSVITCLTALNLTSLLRCASVLPCVPQLWTLPPYWGALWRCHVSLSFRSYLLTEVRSGAVMCPSVSDLVSLSRWAPVLSRITWLRTLLYWEGSSGTATCPTARGSAFLRGELQCYHVSHGSELCLPERGALVLPRVPRSRRAVNHRNKEMLSCPSHVARLTCFQGTLMRYRIACKTCRPLQCGSIIQHRPNWPLLDMATVVIWPDRMAPQRWSCSVQQGGRR